jgi:hypothetical protein
MRRFGVPHAGRNSMTQQIAPYLLVGMEGVMLVGGVWLLARAIKTWRAERHQKKAATDTRTGMAA